jgi:diguanylate cyclase (GGDEF)-like protein
MIDPRIEELTLLAELERTEYILEGPHTKNTSRRRMIAHLIHEGFLNSPDTMEWDPQMNPNQSGVDVVSIQKIRLHNINFSNILSGKQVKLLLGFKGRLRRIELEEQLKSNRLNDPTGLAFSRRHLHNDLAIAIQHAEENNVLSFIMLDMNGLKHINDNYSHEVGDRAIQIYLQEIVSVVGRYGDTYRGEGGDEVYVILPGINFVTAKDLITKALKNISAESIEEYQLSASCGIIQIQSPTIDPSQATDLVDKVQYAAKTESKKGATRQSFISYIKGTEFEVEVI